MTRIHEKTLTFAFVALATCGAALADPVAPGIPGPLAYAPTTAVQHAAHRSAALRVEAFGLENASVTDLRQAARAGHGPSARRLGEIYDNGTEFVRRDVAEAMRWYHIARQQGEDIPTPHTIRIWSR